MGEFNTGKSTFVNALIGQPIAPMGVTPTTATINVLKYGAKPAGRVVYRDDRTREVEWADVPQLLRALDAAQARSIRMVELLYPSEALREVNIVDTPGLNSLIPEHEEVARDFLAQADAVIWLFAVGQAGKQTEAEVLARVRAERKRALGVLNKIDRVSEPELAAVCAHVAEAFGAQLEALVPVSAKQALAGQGGRFAELRAALEERFFRHAREIQRTAARDRLARLYQRARAALPAPAPPRDDERARLDADARDFQLRFLPPERARIRAQAETAVHQAAREVQEFVRPRTWMFGQNEAQPADRDFLIEVLEDAADAIAAGSRERALAALGPAAAPRLDGQVYGPLRAFARGYLRGGRVDAFFTRTLPRMALDEVAIFRALMAEMPDLDEWLLQPLRRAATAHHASLRRATVRADRADRAAALEREHRLSRPLEMLARALETL